MTLKTVQVKMKRLFAIVLSICMLVGTVGNSNLLAYAAEISTSEKTYVLDGCSVNYKVNNSWSNYVTVEMTVSNTGEATMRDWSISFEYDGTIDNIWSTTAVK